uniref:WD repeat domain 74 n=1 Tax=Pygocentrus nattereri TaxID=42514 RepID=A0AAR2IUE4_PYGNA
MADKSQTCSVWLGSETGILKGVSLSKKRAFNFCDMSSVSRDQEICALTWGDRQESEVLVGCVNGSVKTFSTEKGVFTETRVCGDISQGRFTGIAVTDRSLITCVESGLLKVWTEGSADTVEINVGGEVCRMRQNPSQRHRVATGGKENPLKVWDLERPDKPIFTAKNVRVYDPSTPQRRPVLEAEFGEYPLTTLALPAGHDRVVVGNTHGQIAILDLRKGLVRGCMKGLAGSVRGLQCHPSSPLLASCGLDRFLRIHSLEDRSTVHKVYLKSRLNCVLLSSRDLELVGSDAAGEVEEVKEEERDEVWDSMETVSEKGEKRTVEEEAEESRETAEKKEEKKKRKKAKK